MVENNPAFKLYTICRTYNHSEYILDALNGFVMQQTDFPFLCCIIDDDSTDGEQQVICDYVREQFGILEKRQADYADITFARHNLNQNCYFAVFLLKYNHFSINKGVRAYLTEWTENVEYEALCEGDDYWIDPLKLQKQVSYLDSHQECGMCYTNFNILNQISGNSVNCVATTYPKAFPMRYYSPEEFILAKGYVCPPSWVYRRKLIKSIYFLEHSCDGTFEIFSFLLANTIVYYYDFVSSVYRILPESASHSNNINRLVARERCLLDMQIKLLSKYGCSQESFAKCYQKYYRDTLLFYLDNGFWDDVELAEKNLTNKDIKERIFFFLAKSRIGRVFYKVLRHIASLLRRKKQKFFL